MRNAQEVYDRLEQSKRKAKNIKDDLKQQYEQINSYSEMTMSVLIPKICHGKPPSTYLETKRITRQLVDVYDKTTKLQESE